MTLPASGAISLNQVNVELGLSGTASINMNAANVRGLFAVASGAISMSNGYGKSNIFNFSITANTANANISTLATAAGWNGSTNVVCTINSGVWVYSDSTGTAALTIPNAFPNGITIVNYGKVIGKGGSGGQYGTLGGKVGGVSIANSKTGASIQNMSGAYIAGGGGGGAGQILDSVHFGGGGGGAGGGVGGIGRAGNTTTCGGGAAGGLGAVGGRGGSYSQYVAWEQLRGLEGGAGGGAGMCWANTIGGGGGGGRILPGSGGGGNRILNCGVGPGGSGGGGGGGGYNYQGYYIASGGGGWGASGGSSVSDRGGNNSGGGGGKAINSGVSYSLSNSGTIYGGT